jgi:hypothetical protein
MTPQQMAEDAIQAINTNQRMSLVMPKGMKRPPKFPRGELLCENHNGFRVYSHDPEKVLAWLAANELITYRS